MQHMIATDDGDNAFIDFFVSPRDDDSDTE